MLEDLLTSFVKLLDLTMQRQNARPQGQAWKNLRSKFYAHGCVTYIQGNPTCRYVIWMFMFQGSNSRISKGYFEVAASNSIISKKMSFFHFFIIIFSFF